MINWMSTLEPYQEVILIGVWIVLWAMVAAYLVNCVDLGKRHTKTKNKNKHRREGSFC